MGTEFTQPVSQPEYHVVADLSKFSIMVFDPTREVGDQVYTGTLADVKDENSGKPTVVIYQLRSNSPRGMIVFKNM